MKILLLLSLATLAITNLMVKPVAIICDLDSERINGGCMPGAFCDFNHSCSSAQPPLQPRLDITSRRMSKRQDVFSIDGTCGAANSNTVCDPNSMNYKGSCCSAYGYCGDSEAHCSEGCQSGPCIQNGNGGGQQTPDGKCGQENNNLICGSWAQGGCCSSSGWCGNSEAHCGTGCQSGPCIGNAGGKATTDGKCGQQNNNLVCGAWALGGCCSSSGWCGHTTAHCGAGCQSGPCVNGNPDLATPTTQEAIVKPITETMAAGEQATAVVTTDGSCGASWGGTVCGNWAGGGCCSAFGFCGGTTSHCGVGCQSGPCARRAAPGPGPKPAPAHPQQGEFKVVGQAGVPAMHAALMPNGKVFFLDKVEDRTQVNLPNGRWAFSVEYDPQTNTYVPLHVDTNAFCSGGTFLADGRVVSLGGNGPLVDSDPSVGDGFAGIRYLSRPADGSQDGQSWSEPGNKLASARWYASVQTMPDGRLFCASGSLNGLDPLIAANNNPTYEMLSRDGVSNGNNILMDLLDKNQPYYMYPFTHLLKDGSLFIFTSKSSQQFHVGSNAVVRDYPDLDGGFRTYPNTGGSVILPFTSANDYNPDVFICGGGVWQDPNAATDASCGRINPLATDPKWEMDSMPQGRGGVEGTLLPDGTVLWLNGANLGAQGFQQASRPTLQALLYTPDKPLGQRWSTLASSTIPRLYHSVALLLLDGTVMVAGSNPVEQPKDVPDAQDPFVTEWRVENFIPPYLQGNAATTRPTSIVLSSKNLNPGQTFQVSFDAKGAAQKVSVVLYHGGFVTHSLHMGHRMVNLDSTGFTAGAGRKTIQVNMPPNNNVGPPGPYVVYVLVDGVPGVGQFVKVA